MWPLRESNFFDIIWGKQACGGKTRPTKIHGSLLPFVQNFLFSFFLFFQLFLLALALLPGQSFLLLLLCLLLSLLTLLFFLFLLVVLMQRIEPNLN